MPYGISSTSMLKAANDQGKKIYRITSGNAGIIDQLNTTSDVKADLYNGIAAGMTVFVPQGDLNYYGYTGIGYVIEDPTTGAGAYLIDGGRNGGGAPAGKNVFAIPQIPATPAIGLMMGSVLRSAGASLVAENGMIVGIALPEISASAAAGTAGVAIAGSEIIAMGLRKESDGYIR